MHTDSSTTDIPHAAAFQGVVWGHQDTTFKSVKSTAYGFVSGSAIAYGLLKLLQASLDRHWSLKPSPADISIAATLGGIVGGLAGYETLKQAQVYNHRVDVLNRYVNQPEVLQNILSEVGGPDAVYQRGPLERTMGTANTASFWGWLVSEALLHNRGLSQFFFASTALTGLSWFTARIAGLSGWLNSDRKVMSYAERIANERATSQNASTLGL